MFEFWRKWLITGAVASELSGLAMVAGTLIPGGDAVFGWMFDLVFWPLDGGEVTIAANTKLLAGISGAVLTAWGATLWFIARDGFPTREPWVWRAALTGVVTWFVLDGIVSVTVGAGFNVIGNIVYLALLLPPLIATAKDFRVQPQPAGAQAGL